MPRIPLFATPAQVEEILRLPEDYVWTIPVSTAGFGAGPRIDPGERENFREGIGRMTKQLEECGMPREQAREKAMASAQRCHVRSQNGGRY